LPAIRLKKRRSTGGEGARHEYEGNNRSVYYPAMVWSRLTQEKTSLFFNHKERQQLKNKE
jgi:hypothetical protein